MKKSILFICGLALLAAGCAKEQTMDIQQEETPRHLTVNVTVNHDGLDTRAVKTGWEDGDKVYVVFDNKFTNGTNVYYLTLTREGDSWKSEFSDQALVDYLLDNKSGNLAAAYCSGGALELKHKSANVIEVSNWAELPGFVLINSEIIQYNVTDDNVLKATITMALTRPSVQFFIDGVEEDKAGNYSLMNEHLCKYSIKNFQLISSGSSSYPKASVEFGSTGEIITGTYYKEGVLFCCRLALSSVGNETEYVITIVDNRGTPDNDSDDITYTMTNTAELVHKDAVKLPPLTSSRWTKSINGHEFVELGDGLKWATMNIGAYSPEENGDYFAWGETEPYYESIGEDGTVIWKEGKESGYAWASYFDTNDGGSNFTLYDLGGKTVLEAGNDAATANWGGSWRMPTNAELHWLNMNCTKKWTDNYNGTGVAGKIFVSTAADYSGNEIFLPAPGYFNGTEISEKGGYGYYWSSSLGPAPKYSKSMYYVNSSGGTVVSEQNSNRFHGYSVRAVAD